MANEAIHICEACRGEVNPGDPDVIEAAEMKEVTTFGSGSHREYSEGLHAFFHEHHYPHGSRRYKRVPS
jgi:hypothetical protein